MNFTSTDINFSLDFKITMSKRHKMLPGKLKNELIFLALTLNYSFIVTLNSLYTVHELSILANV